VDDYVVASRKLINFHKSEVTSSKNVDTNMRNLVISTLGVQEGLRKGKYLGFPYVVGRNKKARYF